MPVSAAAPTAGQPLSDAAAAAAMAAAVSLRRKAQGWLGCRAHLSLLNLALTWSHQAGTSSCGGCQAFQPSAATRGLKHQHDAVSEQARGRSVTIRHEKKLSSTG